MEIVEELVRFSSKFLGPWLGARFQEEKELITLFVHNMEEATCSPASSVVTVMEEKGPRATVNAATDTE